VESIVGHRQAVRIPIPGWGSILEAIKEKDPKRATIHGVSCGRTGTVWEEIQFPKEIRRFLIGLMIVLYSIHLADGTRAIWFDLIDYHLFHNITSGFSGVVLPTDNLVYGLSI
jgi:uncharacterized protein (UPF0276 family)